MRNVRTFSGSKEQHIGVIKGSPKNIVSIPRTNFTYGNAVQNGQTLPRQQKPSP